MNYTENQLSELAKTNPKELAHILTSSSVNVRTLTFGAEILGGEVTDETIVLPVLSRLIKHVNAIVREGAAIGISSFYVSKKPPQDILDRLKFMSTNDPSPALRDTVKGMLEDYCSDERAQD
jgi:hypothetical protein